MKEEIRIREAVIRAFLEKLDCILSMKLLRVKNYDGACTDGRVIFLPIEYYKKQANNMRDYLLMIKGLNYHELAHVLFTTYTRKQIKKFCADNGIRYNYFFDVLNMLEDMRIENYIVKVYPKCKPYLIYINTVIIKRALKKATGKLNLKYEWMENLWLPQIGKVYLPKRFRMALLKKTNTFDKDTTKKIIDIVNRYINLAREYGKKLKYKKYRKEYELKSLSIAKELYDILAEHDNNVAMPTFTPYEDKGDAVKEYRQDMDEKVLRVIDVDFGDIDEDDIEEMEEEGEEEDKDIDGNAGNGEDKEEEIEEEGEGNNGDKEEGDIEEVEEEEIGDSEEDSEGNEEDDKEDMEDIKASGGSSKDNKLEDSENSKAGDKGSEKDEEDERKELNKIIEEMEKMQEEIKEDVEGEIQQDYELILEIDKELLTAEEDRAREEVEKILSKVVNEYKAHWILRQKEGRINIRHAMKSERNGDTRIFKKFKASKMNELEFRIFLNVDTSGSMYGEKILAVRSMAKVILRAFEKTKSKVKVVGFSNSAELYKDWEDRHIPYLSAGGGTWASLSLGNIVREVREMRRKYKKPIMVITITDGEWFDINEAEKLIKELNKMDVITVEINIEVERYHGSEYCYFIKSVSELPKIMRDLTDKLARQLIKKRQYLI